MKANLTNQICQEIGSAIRTLGGNPEKLNLRDVWKVNRTLEFLGADAYLLATIASWAGSLMPEAAVLDHLRGWNKAASRSLKPVSSIISK
jgi:hypothetical protein